MPIRFDLTRPAGIRQQLGAAIAGLGMAATIGGALWLEHVGGYIPCALCLTQRVPYYVAIPLAAAAFLSARLKAPAVLTRLLLLAVMGAMLYAAYLGVFHAGVEWGWWPGPADCGAVGSLDLSGDLLAQLDATRPPACEEPALWIFGLSLAAWNALIATVLSGIAFRAALAGGDRFVI